MGQRKFFIRLLPLSIVFLFLHALNIDMVKPMYDAQQYLSYSYNLLKHGVYSKSTSVSKIVPDTAREPGHPVMLAISMMLHPGIDVSKDSIKCIAFGMQSCHEKISYLKIPGLILMIVSAAMAAWFCYSVSGRMWTGLMCFVLTGSSMSLGHFCDRFYAEVTATFLLTLFSLLLSQYDKSGWKLKSIMGIILSMLILTKAIFLYLVPVIAVVMAFKHLRLEKDLKKAVTSVGILLIPVVIIVGSWTLRNKIVDDTLSISTRGGMILMIRSYMNEMLYEHYWTAVGYYAGGYWKRNVVENEPDEVLKMFRAKGSGGFKSAGLRHTSQIRKRLRIGGEELDSKIREEAGKRILKNWHKHLAMILPVALNGINVEMGLGVRHGIRSQGTLGKKLLGFDLTWLKLHLPDYFNYLLFASLFSVFIAGVLYNNTALWCFCLPAIYSFGIHSAATHYIFRYSIPLLPVLYACFSLVIYRLWIMLSSLLRDKS